MSKYLMSVNLEFSKLCLVHNFLSTTTSIKKELLDELVVYATDPVIRMRRTRMLENLCTYEAQILKKIQTFQTDDPRDFDLGSFYEELQSVVSRSA